MITDFRFSRSLVLGCAVVGGVAFATVGPAHSAEAHSAEVRSADTSSGVSLPSPYAVAANSESAHGRAMELPKILSATDQDLYRRIFDLQDGGNWKKADRLIGQLENSVLLGHVLAQRYLHPTRYRSKYPELKDWLALYNDHPEARRLYKLALRRKPANWKMPKKPVRIVAVKKQVDTPARKTLRIPSKRLSPPERRKARQYKRHIRNALRHRHTLVAKRALQSKDVQKLLSQAEFDEARAKLGQAYFSDGRDEWALKWAEAAARRSGKYVPQAHWAAGLASWRLGKKQKAADHFAKAAELSHSDDWFHAGAAFWAARAYMITRQPDRVNRFLDMAAKHRYTFYGLLARRVLGEDPGFSWELPETDRRALQKLTAMPAGRRTLALLQVGHIRRAESELRKLVTGADREFANGILALAAHSNMASLAVRLGRQLYPNGNKVGETGGGYALAAYPVPEWSPTEGFRVDRALIYALIRQESNFNPKAKSWAGARGLMQLMPRTASFVARDQAYRWGKRARLYKPEHNIDLGQRYIEILLKSREINGDLFLLTAAWNGGPGNLNKWRRKNRYKDDPLFFIESIPSRETRIFIERVLANLWIYRDRFGQETPSLDAIAQGDWPVYMALGQEPQEVAEVNGTPE